MENYISYLQNDQKDPKTIVAYVKSVAQFKDWYLKTTGHDFLPENITSLDIKEYMGWLATNQKQSPRTLNKKLGGLKSYFGYLFEQDIIPVNPATKVKAKKISALQQTPKWLERHEQSRLLHAIEKEKNTTNRLRDYAIAQIMLQAGLRVFEVAALDIDDIDFRRNTIIIRDGKGDKMAILPMNKDLNRALRAYLEVRDSQEQALFISEKRRRLTDRGIQHRFRKYFDQIGMLDTTIHSLRHSFCKNLLDQGVELTVVSQLARHESLDTTRVYLTPGEKHLRLAVEKITWGD